MLHFKADKITHKELADGTIRLYVDTGEYEYDKVMKGLRELRSDFGRQEAVFDVKIEGESQQQVSSQDSSENKFDTLWTKIDSLAGLKDLDKEELASKLKKAWSIESFTELSEEDREKLVKSIQSDIDAQINEKLDK